MWLELNVVSGQLVMLHLKIVERLSRLVWECVDKSITACRDGSARRVSLQQQNTFAQLCNFCKTVSSWIQFG